MGASEPEAFPQTGRKAKGQQFFQRGEGVGWLSPQSAEGLQLYVRSTCSVDRRGETTDLLHDFGRARSRESLMHDNDDGARVVNLER